MKVKNLLVILLGLFLVIGCTKKEAGQAASGGKTKVRVTVWVGQDELNALENLTKNYNTKKPDVEIEYININGGGQYGREKLQTMIAGGDAPDLMMLNTGQFEALAARNIIYSLDAFVQKESFDFSPYWPVAIEGCKYRGKLYGLPRDMSNVILFYNKDMFDAANVPYPTLGWTFSQMLAAAEKLTIDKDKDGNIDQWGFAVNNVVWAWAGHVWANGGEILNDERTKVLLDNPKSIEALDDFFVKLNKFAPPPGALPDQAWSGDQMVNKSVAMGLFGPWFRPDLTNMENKFRWDVAHYPVADRTGKQATVAYVDMWGIYNQTKVAETAWDFMKYLSSKEAQELWVQYIGARSISPIIEVARSEDWINYGGSSGGIILDALNYARVPPINFSSAMEVETIWDQELASVIIGDESVQTAVKKIVPQVQQVLDESN